MNLQVDEINVQRKVRISISFRSLDAIESWIASVRVDMLK